MKFELKDDRINSLQLASIRKLIERAKHAHCTDIVMRINGADEVIEADWLKHLELHSDKGMDS